MKGIKKLQKFSLRLFAILSGFLLWLYVLSSAETKIEKNVKIHFILPAGHSVLTQSTKVLTYSLEGPRALVRNILNSDKNVKINIKNLYKEGKLKYEVPVSNIGMNFPFGVNIKSVEPKTLKVQLDKTLEKKIPVTLQTVGKIPSDHKLIQQTLFPKEITIKGPRSIVKKFNEVKTLPLNLDNITQSDTRRLSLYKLDDQIEYSQQDVDYQFEIQPTRANLLIKNVPISFFTTRTFKRPNRRFVNLMVLAENGELLEKSKAKIKVVAEVPDDAIGETEIELKAQMPEGLHLLEIIPNKLNIQVTY